MTLSIDADNRLTLSALKGDGTYLNAATVTYAVKTRGGTTVTGGSGSLLSTSSTGDYSGIIDAAITAALDEGTEYHVWVTAVEGGYRKTWRESAFAQYAT